MQDQSAQVLVAAPAATAIFPRHYVTAASGITQNTSINNIRKNNKKFVILPKSETFHSHTVLEEGHNSSDSVNSNHRITTDKFTRHKIVKQKSDYSLSTRKNRNLYENLCNEAAPLIAEYHHHSEKGGADKAERQQQPGCDSDAITLTNDDKSVLVFTKKKVVVADNQKKAVIARRDGGGGLQESSLVGGNHSSSLPSKAASKWRHSWYAPIYGVLEEESEHNFKVGGATVFNYLIISFFSFCHYEFSELINWNSLLLKLKRVLTKNQ